MPGGGKPALSSSCEVAIEESDVNEPPQMPSKDDGHAQAADRFLEIGEDKGGASESVGRPGFADALSSNSIDVDAGDAHAYARTGSSFACSSPTARAVCIEGRVWVGGCAWALFARAYALKVGFGSVAAHGRCLRARMHRR